MSANAIAGADIEVPIVALNIRSLSVESSDAATPIEGIAITLRTTSIFAGPHHLAALLEKAGGSLVQDALVLTPPPGGSDAERWKEWLRSEAQRWPFLWENHRDAVATGYLDTGSSLVMTTPTGSGKTTLAALKVASTLATGKTVLYPSPYHYALSRTLEISTRPEVIAAFEPLSADIERQPDDDFDTVREKLEAVTLAMTFSDISEEDIAALFKQVDQTDEDD